MLMTRPYMNLQFIIILLSININIYIYMYIMVVYVERIEVILLYFTMSLWYLHVRLYLAKN